MSDIFYEGQQVLDNLAYRSNETSPDLLDKPVIGKNNIVKNSFLGGRLDNNIRKYNFLLPDTFNYFDLIVKDIFRIRPVPQDEVHGYNEYK